MSRVRPPSGPLSFQCVKVLVTGGAGFIGSHIVDLLVDDGHDVRVLDSLLPLAHASRPDYLNPGAEFIQADVADREAAGGRARWRRCGQPSGRDGRARRRLRRRRPTTCATTTSAPRSCSASWPAATSAAASCWPAAWSSTARAATAAPSTARCAPDRDAPTDLEAGRFEPRCRVCGGPLTPRPITEDGRLDPRNVYAATKLHQEHLCAAFARETGGHRDRAALPQRLRTADAP